MLRFRKSKRVSKIQMISKTLMIMKLQTSNYSTYKFSHHQNIQKSLVAIQPSLNVEIKNSTNQLEDRKDDSEKIPRISSLITRVLVLRSGTSSNFKTLNQIFESWNNSNGQFSFLLKIYLPIYVPIQGGEQNAFREFERKWNGNFFLMPR